MKQIFEVSPSKKRLLNLLGRVVYFDLPMINLSICFCAFDEDVGGCFLGGFTFSIGVE